MRYVSVIKYYKKTKLCRRDRDIFIYQILTDNCCDRRSNGPYAISSRYKASWTEQFSAVFWRSWLNVKKEPALVKNRIIETMV